MPSAKVIQGNLSHGSSGSNEIAEKHKYWFSTIIVQLVCTLNNYSIKVKCVVKIIECDNTINRCKRENSVMIPLTDYIIYKFLRSEHLDMTLSSQIMWCQTMGISWRVAARNALEPIYNYGRHLHRVDSVIKNSLGSKIIN